VPRTAATSVALVAWATSFVLVTILGLGFLLLPGGRPAAPEAADGKR
jgi:hypothetical protein